MWNFKGPRIPSFLILVACLILYSFPGHAFEQSTLCSTFEWEQIPPNQWIQLATCGEPPRKVFHGASALASDRRTVFFFGADTHEEDYDNSVYRLSLIDLRWSRDYEADALESYRVTSQGHPVTTTNRPWAMHAFDGWDYDPIRKTLVLVGIPRHATQALQHVKDQGTLSQPIQSTTWHYDPDTHSWTLIPIRTPNLFAGGLAWDQKGNRFIGHNGYQTFHYDPVHSDWVTYEASSMPGYHLRLVHDTFSHTFLSLGNNQSSRMLWSYSSQSVLWKRIIVAHEPLPANGAAIAYNSRHHVLVYVANDSSTPYSNPSGKSVTFIYNSQEQRWVRLLVKSPPLFGMNYLTQYDHVSDVVLHFEKAHASNEIVSLWGFRYQPETQ